MDCAISHHVNAHCGLSHLHDAEHGRPIYGPTKIVVVVQAGQLDRSPARFLAYTGQAGDGRLGVCVSVAPGSARSPDGPRPSRNRQKWLTSITRFWIRRVVAW